MAAISIRLHSDDRSIALDFVAALCLRALVLPSILSAAKSALGVTASNG